MERSKSKLDYTPGRSSDVARSWDAPWHLIIIEFIPKFKLVASPIVMRCQC